jgi:2-dehydro-3-deoxyphosphooctonate aldolase (KDO 8-P synthase)
VQSTEPSVQTVEVGDVTTKAARFGDGLPLAWIVGPSVIEEQSLMANAAERLKKLGEKLEVPVVFKSSYERDNRASEDCYEGPGIDEGLELLAWIRKEFELPVVADVHRVDDLAAAREVLDMIQIPALLCEQTSLLVAAAQTGRVINVQKGPFLAPEAMAAPVARIVSQGNTRILLTEHGASFGYDDRIADMTAIPTMKELGYPVIFDARHQIGAPERLPAEASDPNPHEFVAVLLRSAIAAGANGVFLESHPHPSEARSSSGQFPLDRLEDLMTSARDLADLIRTQGHA